MYTDRMDIQRLLWIDLEMTGLDAQKDRIVELAAIVTDQDLNEIAVYESSIRHADGVVESLLQANEWFIQQSDEYRSGLIQSSHSGKDEAEVELDVIDFLAQHIPKGDIVLAGNSIHSDRKFIDRWMPGLAAKLHYRMLDVSSWKVWNYATGQPVPVKKEAHRALDDIRESIAELKMYTGE